MRLCSVLILIEISETLVSGLHLDITQKFRQKPELSIYNRGAGRSNDHSDSIWLMRVVSVGYKEKTRAMLGVPLCSTKWLKDITP